MFRWLFAVLGFTLVSGGVFAEGVADGADSYFGDFPVVLSASRLVQTVSEAPAEVTVIDQEMIKTSGAREVVDLFRLVPGMVVGQYKSHQPTLGFFGFSGPLYRQLQVLIDGVSIYSSAWGGAEWSELPISLEDIERIEVVRGPNAATFGANSFLGVVNIITRDPAVEHDRELVANIGENHIRDTHVRYSVGNGELRYRLTAGQRADDGLDSYPDSRRTNFLNLRAHLRLNAGDELRVQTAYAGGSQESGVYGGGTDGPRTAHYDSGAAQIRWTRMRGVDEELWLQFSHSQRNFRDVVPYGRADLFADRRTEVPMCLRESTH
jgi:iron complex outermembrane receptor protein